MKTPTIAILVLAGLAAGLAVGWGLAAGQADREMPPVVLVHQLETATLCALALSSLEADEGDKATLVLETWLASSLSEADRLLTSGVSPGESMAIPNLHEGVRRAVAYADRDAVSPALRQRAADVLAQLDALQKRGAS